MEAVFTHKHFKTDLPLGEVLDNFFKGNTPESARVFFWKVFQCWALKDCNIKAEISDAEIALFFDQLIDLVAAAYIVHQANGASNKPQGGDNNG